MVFEKLKTDGFIIVNIIDGEKDNVKMLFDLDNPRGRRLAKLYQQLKKIPKKKLFKIKL